MNNPNLCIKISATISIGTAVWAMNLITIFAVRYVREAGPWRHTNKNQSRSLINKYFYILIRFIFKCIILFHTKLYCCKVIRRCCMRRATHPPPSLPSQALAPGTVVSQLERSLGDANW